MANSRRQIRVVKIGGSLLDLPGLNQRIDDWISRQPFATTIWIVGGGELVEEIRRQNERGELDSEDTHWACIEKMDETATRVASWFPNWKLIDTLDGLSDQDPAENIVLTPLNWSRQHASHLPKTWAVTSDSIAAQLANWIGAFELVLLKSAEPPVIPGIQAAIDCEFVDGCFFEATYGIFCAPTIGPSMPVRVVNLRSDAFREIVWRN